MVVVQPRTDGAAILEAVERHGASVALRVLLLIARPHVLQHADRMGWIALRGDRDAHRQPLAVRERDIGADSTDE